MGKDVVKTVRPFIEEIVKANNLNLFELEFVKEDGMWFLRVSIEKDDGTMDFETAEVISNLVSDKLDELDPIEHEYVLDVCSPGAERPIRNKEEFLANLNEYISVYLDEEDENKKDMYTGDLLEVNDEDIVISYKDKTRVKKAKINFKNIIKAHIAIKF
ncbi:MAG: ribosome maturation factor RimP [Bacilli bacterium]|jgi:ribosome maturation factor RimP|nr:ribosome maturation factor RimP [Bacilli bacterium]